MLALAWLAARSWTRNAEWHSDLTIHAAGVRDNPRNVKMITNYALMLHDQSKESHRDVAERRQLLLQVERLYSDALRSNLVSGYAEEPQ